jgi:NAD(P)H-nitrite reductase large subunit
MIVCNCFNVAEREVKECLPCTVTEAMERTGAGLSCGACTDVIREIIREGGEMVDTGDFSDGRVNVPFQKSPGLGHAGSIPAPRT